MKGKVLAAVAGLVALIGLVAYVHNARSAVAAGSYRVACIASGADIGGSDQMLQDVAHVGHTPAEGGRCYFKFNSADVTGNTSPMMASRMRSMGYKTYASAKAGAVRGTKNAVVKGLFDKLNQGAISRSQYGGEVVGTWEDVAAHLNK